MLSVKDRWIWFVIILIGGGKWYFFKNIIEDLFNKFIFFSIYFYYMWGIMLDI